MQKIITVLIAAALFVLAGCSRGSGSKEGDNYTAVETDDAKMNAAIARAKETIGEFVTAFHAKKPGTTDYFVKKPYATPDGGHEHMWIEVTDESNGVLKGVVANEAEDTREVRNGQRVTLKLSEISDWKYQDGKKLIGGYTIRYFIEKMPPAERKTFLEQAGFEL
jgi:uncharacterized protein YegJ (DUF2314 family)